MALLPRQLTRWPAPATALVFLFLLGFYVTFKNESISYNIDAPHGQHHPFPPPPPPPPAHPNLKQPLPPDPALTPQPLNSIAIEKKFMWKDLTPKYPVHGLISLPQGSTHQLRQIQHTFGDETAAEKSIRLERQANVVKVFKKCYKSYKERAWTKDELSPISGGSRDAFGGWAATLVDTLDTLYIMDMHEELKEAIAASANIDFSTSTEKDVSIFETTIRYLGGFLSAYDLTGDQLILKKAIEVGDMLLVSFDTPNHMPIARWDWEAATKGTAQVASEATLASEIGSLSLEFTRLSQITQDMRWYDAIARITNLLNAQQDTTNLPGMWPAIVNARDMIFNEGSWFTLGGSSDSLYEYFPKAYALLGGQEPVYEKLYTASMTTAIQHLFFRPMVPLNPDILITGTVRTAAGTVSLDPEAQHLGCFTGGMLALGSKLFDVDNHLEIARKLTHGCIWAYNASLHGIMPETTLFVPCPIEDSNCTWDEAKYTNALLGKHPLDNNPDQIVALQRLPRGFIDIKDRQYFLRPEAIESVFILYRTTGDKALLEHAWNMWEAITRLTETEFAHAAVKDVTEENVQLDDRMESFWMAETLKYFYLIFSEPSLISLDGWVFNTEAHPLKRPG